LVNDTPQVIYKICRRDEWAAAERERVSNLVKNIAANIPVLIVEHDIDRVLGFSKTVTVMNQGEVLMSACPDAVRADLRVQEIYTGTGIPAVEHQRADETANAAPALLRFERVNTFYGKSHILNDATLNVREGEIVALLGRNGAGKSTLLKTIAGLVTATSGSIEFGGQDVARWPATEIARRGIGFVPQGREIFPLLTVEENLKTGFGPLKRDDRYIPDDVFSLFPVLQSMLGRRGGDLSGGQQQQLAIGRALVMRPKLLLLDEPTEGIQPSIIKDIGRAISYLRSLGNIAIVLVEQYLDFACELGDNFAVMDRGAVKYSCDRSNLDPGEISRQMAL